MRFKGVSTEPGEVVVREVESNFPIVMVTSYKEVVEFPLKPGKYYVDTELLRERALVDLRKTNATVGK